MKLFFVLAVINFAHSNAFSTIKLKIKSDVSCDSDAELFISQNKKVILQLPVFQNVESEFAVNEGEFDYHIFGRICQATGKFLYPKEKKISVSLSSHPKDTKERKPSNTGLSSELSYVPRYSINGLSTNYNNYIFPYWNSFYRNTFLNPWQPCMINGFGCSQMYYPTFYPQSPVYNNGPMIMGKPNIYFTGEDAKIKIIFANQSHKRFVASTPSLQGNTWSIELKNNQINFNGQKLPYLFFDAKTPQNGDYNLSAAFCGERLQVYNFMIGEIEERKFPKRAVNDFKEYWSMKLPEQESCVFPQIEKNIQSFFPLEISANFQSQNKPVSMNRIYFAVIPKNAKPSELPLKFKQNPKKWQSEKREPASAQPIEMYEWGVGFLLN